MTVSARLRITSIIETQVERSPDAALYYLEHFSANQIAEASMLG